MPDLSIHTALLRTAGGARPLAFFNRNQGTAYKINQTLVGCIFVFFECAVLLCLDHDYAVFGDTPIPTVQQLELKREHIQIRTEIEVNSDRLPNWPARKKYIEGANLERKALAEDYRNRFNRLVTVSRNITRVSPAAAFTFLATDVMGTGMAEERRLKRAFLQCRDILWDWDERGERPAFDYQRSSIKKALGPGGLSNCLILILFNMLFFTGAYVAFLRYDAR